MQVVYSHSCGIEVHNAGVTACVLVFDETGGRKLRKKQFATHWKALRHLRFFLCACRVTHVTMESTGVYRQAVWTALQEHFHLILANPHQVKIFRARTPIPKTPSGRIHKVLEDDCLKLDTVASDILGETGRAIIRALIRGEALTRLAGGQDQGEVAHQAQRVAIGAARAGYGAPSLDARRLDGGVGV